MAGISGRPGELRTPWAAAVATGIMLSALPVSAQPVVYVNHAAQGRNNGLTWADAYRSLQDALDHARRDPERFTEVWVAAGRYTPAPPDGDRAAAFYLVEGVGIYGGFAGTEGSREERLPEVHVTTLSGDLNGDDERGQREDNSYHVVYGDQVAASAIIDGFTITAGHADGSCCGYNRGGGLFNVVGEPTVARCRFLANVAFSGGAIFNIDGAPSLRECDFDLNRATSGSAIYTLSGRWTATRCRFQDNAASGSGAVFSDEGAISLLECEFSRNTASSGGAVFADGGSVEIEHCTFFGNVALHVNGGAGGAIRCEGAVFRAARCSFQDNAALELLLPGTGGAMDIRVEPPEPDGLILTDCTFLNNSASHGGALYVSTSLPTLERGTLRGNRATFGGAIYVAFGGHPSVKDSSFDGNTASFYGGAVYHAGSSASTLRRCTFTHNNALSGGAIAAAPTAAPIIQAAIFYANEAQSVGGGVYSHAADLTLVHCGFFGNTAEFGGGVYCLGGGLPHLFGCVLSGNRSDLHGAAVACFDADGRVEYCSLQGNVAGSLGGGIHTQAGRSTVVGSVLWQNLDNTGFGPSSQISGPAEVNYSLVMGGWQGGEGNLDADPRFVDPDGADNIHGTPDDDLRLPLDSPCVDAADNSAVPADISDVDNDGDTEEPTPFDADRHPRFYDIPSVPDTGRGERPVVDMGPYEDYDCNENGHPDDEDIREGRSKDCNENLIPDECELDYNDCNENGFPDDCDVKEGRSEDCNENLIPDECELDDNDCNENQIPDECDIREGRSQDCNGNQVPDECELNENDCNDNRIPDECDISEGRSEDCNKNHIPDECDIESGYSRDDNHNGRPDECDCVVDVVFVMDVSGSMADELEALCGVVDNVIRSLAELKITVNGTLLGITQVPQGEACAQFPGLVSDVVTELGNSVPRDPGACGRILDELESWGPATAIVADRFGWAPEGTRIIVPMSDEGACRGDPCHDPGPDRDSISNAVTVANAAAATVLAVTGTGADSCVRGLADDLADGTGGRSFHIEGGISHEELQRLLEEVIVAQVGDACSDCNHNGLPDSEDILNGRSRDRNLNGVPDECEIPCEDLRRFSVSECAQGRFDVGVVFRNRDHDGGSVVVTVNGKAKFLAIKGRKAKGKFKRRTGEQTVVLVAPFGCFPPKAFFCD